ncbi:MAG TPA: hypothetical protein VG826_10220 [Pirellulales bacterium]|nr:hypothetical protein [Pirellulales bacterium]
MSIEFPCSQCGKLLRVGDEAAGKQARCPSCGAVQGIPATAPSSQSPFGAAPPAAGPTTEVNPYQAPVSTPWRPAGAVAHGPFQQMPIDASDILNRTWIIFKSQFWMITLTAFVWWVTQAGFSLVCGQLVSMVLFAGVGVGNQPDQLTLIASQIVIQGLGFLFGTWLELGMAIYMLKTARGESAGIGDLFAGGPYWPAAILARFLYFLGIVVGSVLLIVPGIIVALMFSQYMYLIIDRREGPLDALGTSYRLTNGSKGHLFILGIAVIGVNMLGFLACCVGIFPALGFVALMWAVAFLAMTGQPTVDAILEQPAAAPFVPPSGEIR